MQQPQQNESHCVHHAHTSHSVATYRRRTVRLLIAHNHLRDVDLWLQELKRVQFAVSAEVVQTPETFAEHLRAHQYDVVLASSGMPNWSGLQVLEFLRLLDGDIPFIFLGTDSEDNVMEEFLAKGASDCVYRNRLGRLPIAVAIAVEQRSIREEHNRAQIELRRSEAHYHALVENPNYGICRFDLSGRLLMVNKALSAMLGYDSADELVTKNLATDIIHDPVERAQLFDSYRLTGNVAPIEIEFRRKDGTPMRVRLSGQRADARHGEPEESCDIITRTSPRSAPRRTISATWPRQTPSPGWQITAN